MLCRLVALLCALHAAAAAPGCCKHLPLVKAGILNATREPWWKFHADEPRCGDNTQPCSVRTCKACWSGLVPDLHARLSEHMGYDYELVAAPPGATDAELLQLLRDGVVTMLPHELGATSFTPEMRTDFAYSQPFVAFSYSALVKADKRDVAMWAIFEPFSLDVYLATIGVVAVLAVLFCALEWGETGGVVGMARGTDFVVSSLLGGMEYDGVRREGWVGRFLRVGLLFFVLIITATYTANLASILTAKKVILGGPRNMQQLKTSTVCNFDRLPVRMSISDHARNVSIPQGFDSEWEATKVGRAACLEQLMNGDVDAVVANVLELKQMQRDFGYCERVQLIPLISFNPRYVVFLTTKANEALAQHLTEAIVAMQSNKLLISMMDENYGGFCTEEADLADTQVQLKHLSGLFVILACFAFVAVCMKGVQAALASRSRAAAGGGPVTERSDSQEGEMLEMESSVEKLSPPRVVHNSSSNDKAGGGGGRHGHSICQPAFSGYTKAPVAAARSRRSPMHDDHPAYRPSVETELKVV